MRWLHLFKVPALAAAHQEALKQAMSAALRANGHNTAKAASAAPPALKKIDMSQYKKT
jgi:hypothetical protein